MKIGIDIRTACSPKTGKGWYTFYLVRELLILDKKNEYFLYTNDITANLSSFIGAHIKIIHKNQLLWHFAVMKDFEREGGGLFFAPTSFIIPAFLPRRIKSITTVHDLVAFLHPHLHDKKATILEYLFFRRALKKTSRALVPSQNTKRDLTRMFRPRRKVGVAPTEASERYPEEKITVTPLAVADSFFQKPSAEKLNQICAKYHLPKDFVLTVSGLEPRKNVGMLVDVMLRQAQHDISLVIVGGRGWQSKKLQEKIARHKDKIIYINHCEPNELPAFYHLAKVFAYPSLYEGFGLPPLEAMATGCPVICSNAASLPEVCGDAAVLFNPKNPAEFQNALHKVLNDEKLRSELREKGLQQAKKFSWKHTAELTLKTFNMLQ